MNQADIAIQFAREQIGKPYKFGATGPNAYDCSGLVQAAYHAAGIQLPRTTMQQIFAGQKVASESQLQPGDLRFPDAGHVQLYVGGGQVIEAPTTGENVRQTNAWGSFYAGRRVTSPGISLQTTGLATSNPITSGWDSFTGLSNFAEKLTQPNTWLRAGMIIGGVVLLWLAFEVLVVRREAGFILKTVGGATGAPTSVKGATKKLTNTIKKEVKNNG
jgi:hypothetical protein